MEETPLSPVLLRFPLVDRATGLVTRPWQQWFTASWYRQGGANAPPNDALGGELGVLETALEATQAALAATQAALEATQAQLAATQAELEATQAALAATQAELETTQAELEATQAALAATQTELDATQAALAATQAELETTQAELEATQAELDATQAEIDALLPDGTARAVARYQADGTGVEASPMTINALGEVTAIATAATTGLTVSLQGTGQTTPLLLDAYTNSIASAQVNVRKARGTPAAPAKLNLTTDQIMTLNALGYVRNAADTADTWITLAQWRTGIETLDAQGRAGAYTSLWQSPGVSAALAERLRVTENGNVGVGTSAPTARLDVAGDTLRLRTARTPASATAAGNQGDVAWDSSYLFICTATNTWRRVAHATW